MKLVKKEEEEKVRVVFARSDATIEGIVQKANSEVTSMADEEEEVEDEDLEEEVEEEVNAEIPSST